MQRFNEAVEMYKEIGVDVNAAIEKLNEVQISIHCWQGDDVSGFENDSALSGGIAATGNYPYKARNADELKRDLKQSISLMPGKQRVNLHAMYAETDGEVARDKLEPKHFEKWIQFAKENNLGLDFNPTLFSHANVCDGLTLSSPKEEIRRFWIDHCKATRKIAAYMGKELGTPCLHNIWIPDGLKDVPGDRLSPRRRLKESLDEIYAEKLDSRHIIDCVESKVFGIGMESYTVGSHDFYLSYAAKNNILCLIDNGHFHPTENSADKISSLLLFFDKVALHVTRAIRWDSDHVLNFNDELREIASEIVKCDGLDKVLIGLDFFDASINRVAAWVIGGRNMRKAMLYALLLPCEKLSKLQDQGNFTELMELNEKVKVLPFGDIWNNYCEINSTPKENEWLNIVKKYEKDVMSNRVTAN